MLRPGDVFNVASDSKQGRCIRRATRFWSHDKDSKTNHSGIILDGAGNTIEAMGERWRTVKHNISAYQDRPILIARPFCTSDGRIITNKKKRGAIRAIELLHLGQIYPHWRIPLFLIPPLACLGQNHLVCSELTAKYLFLIGIRHKQYRGTNPDTLADEYRRGKGYKIIVDTIP